MVPKLTYPVLLGGPFLQSNKIVIDHEFGCVTAKDDQYQLLPTLQDGPMDSPQDEWAALQTGEPEEVLWELQEQMKGKKDLLDKWLTMEPAYRHFAEMLDNRIEILVVWDDLVRYEQEI